MTLTSGRAPVTGKRVQLMATCLCDAFHDDVAAATVEVLEHLGCEVAFPEGQTCCGQPAFNGGDWDSSRWVVRHTVRTFSGDDPVVVPSGSCAAMLFHGAALEFEHEPDLGAVQGLGRRTWELGDYIVNGLGVRSWPGRLRPARCRAPRPAYRPPNKRSRGSESIPTVACIRSSSRAIKQRRALARQRRAPKRLSIHKPLAVPYSPQP